MWHYHAIEKWAFPMDYTMCMSGTGPRSSVRAIVLFTTEPTLKPQKLFLVPLHLAQVEITDIFIHKLSYTHKIIKKAQCLISKSRRKWMSQLIWRASSLFLLFIMITTTTTIIFRSSAAWMMATFTVRATFTLSDQGLTASGNTSQMYQELMLHQLSGHPLAQFNSHIKLTIM